MKKLLAVALLLLTVGCTKTKTVVVEGKNYDKEIAALELAQKANEQAIILNSNNDALVSARVTALEQANQDGIVRDAEIAASLAAYQTAQASINASLQQQITDLKEKQASDAATLQANIDALAAREDANSAQVQEQIADLQQQITNTEVSLQMQINSVSATAAQLRADLDKETEERKAADADLQRQIDEMNSIMNININTLTNNLYSFVNTQLSTVTTDITSLTNKVLALESLNSTVNNLVTQVNSLEANAITSSTIMALREEINSIYATKDMLNAVNGQIANLTTQILSVSGTVSTLANTVAGSGTSILKVPCAGSTEVVLKVGDSFFNSATKSSLVNVLGVNVLSNTGSYLQQMIYNTTYTSKDGTNCQYKVVPSGILVQVGN